MREKKKRKKRKSRCRIARGWHSRASSRNNETAGEGGDGSGKQERRERRHTFARINSPPRVRLRNYRSRSARRRESARSPERRLQPAAFLEGFYDFRAHLALCSTSLSAPVDAEADSNSKGRDYSRTRRLPLPLRTRRAICFANNPFPRTPPVAGVFRCTPFSRTRAEARVPS